MKKSGAGGVILLALVLVTGLSILYWREVGERLMTANTSVGGAEFPIFSVETEEAELALSFQVKGSVKNLEKILEILKQYGAKASFFIDGKWAKACPEGVEAILKGGHDLGNSGQKYKAMTELTQKECREQIMKFHETVKNTWDYEMDLFSVPFGSYDNGTIRNIYACGYYPVCWSVDTLDWKNYGEQDILRQVLEHKNLKNGAIIRWNTHGKYTVSALEKVLCRLKEKGYQIVPVSQLVYRKNFYMDTEGRQFSKDAMKK